MFSHFLQHELPVTGYVDREKCKKLGLSIADVFNTLQTYLGSRYVNDFSIYGRNFHVVAQADTTYRGTIQDYPATISKTSPASRYH